MTQQHNEEQTLEDIVKALLGLEGELETEAQEELTKVTDMIFETSLIRTLGAVDEERRKAFNSFIETNPNEVEMNDYIQTNLSEFQTYIKEELDNLKNM